MAALVTNITIDFVIALVTYVTRFRNVPVDTFTVMVAYVANAHYWLPCLQRLLEVFSPADIFLSC
jgi:hypothetical protein